MRAASSRVPASWQAPPVRTRRRPAATSKPRGAQAGLDLAEDLLQPGLDDAGQHGARHAQGGIVALLAHLGHRHDIGAAFHVAHRRAIERLGAFGGAPAARPACGRCRW